MTAMKRTLLVLALTFGALLILNCGAQEPGSSPESAAKTSFEEFAKNLKGAYRNASFEILERDDAFTRVRIVIEYRDTPASEWTELETEIQVSKKGAEWTAPEVMTFTPTARQRATYEAQSNATATAEAVSSRATATAFVDRVWNNNLVQLIDVSFPDWVACEHYRDLSQFEVQHVTFTNLQVTAQNRDSEGHVLEIKGVVWVRQDPDGPQDVTLRGVYIPANGVHTVQTSHEVVTKSPLLYRYLVYGHTCEEIIDEEIIRFSDWELVSIDGYTR